MKGGGDRILRYITDTSQQRLPNLLFLIFQLYRTNSVALFYFLVIFPVLKPKEEILHYYDTNESVNAFPVNYSSRMPVTFLERKKKL